MDTYSEKTYLGILARKLKWRVYGLLAIYGLIIVASLVLFVYVIRYSTLTFLDIMHSGTVDKPEIGFILLLIAITAVIMICVGTALAPLVNVLAHKTEKGIEIKREDYPDLFCFIDSIVKEVGCKSPKHVYIDEDRNAGLFYNGIWGYCFQRLNLVIRIPLLFGMNKTELKAILSHEFGHFAQKSISTRRIAFISECLFGGFVTMADLDKKKADDTGITERFFARLSMKIMLRQYSEVDPLMAVLSRAQEYDADKYAYDVVGTDGFLSALTKTAEQSARWNDRFIPWLVDRIDEKRVPNDIFATFSNFSAKIDSFVGDSFTPDTHMTRPLGEYEFRVTRIDDQESHPSLFKRCNAISSLPVKKTEWDDTPAFDFFPKQVIEGIFNSVATILKDQRYPDTTVFFKKEDFQGINIISIHDIVNPSFMASDLAMKDKMWNFLEDGCDDKNDLYSISSYILDLVKKHFSFFWDIIKYELIFPAIEANNKA